MSDDNPWHIFLARRAHGVREVHVPTVISEERRLETWERAVENIARELERQKSETQAGDGPCSLS